MKLIDNPKAEQKNDDPMPSHIVNYLEDTPPGAPCLLREESPPKIDAWMPLYVGDLIADTLHLSRADFGSYVLLILLYWRRRGPLPDDDNALSAAARVPLADWPPVRKVLAPFFQIGDGVWRHKRIDKELANSISLREAKSRAGKLGNKVRWGDKSQGDASASRAEVPNSVAKDRSSPSSSSTCNSLERERTKGLALRKSWLTRSRLALPSGKRVIGFRKWKVVAGSTTITAQSSTGGPFWTAFARSGRPMAAPRNLRVPKPKRKELMQRINRLVSNVLTEIKAPTMKAKRIFTQNPSLLFEFSTCRDPQLERMLGNVNEFAGALVDPTSQPYCLSLLGSSGVGKSYLLEKLRAIARITPHLQRHPTLIPGACAQYRYWPEVVDDLQDWDSGRTLVRQLVDCPFLVLDDVFSPLDKSGWKAERALRILEGRKGKWTALSANATREEIAQIDTRIMSRLIRDDNVVIDVDTTDYANRPKDGLAIGFRLIDAEHRDYQAIVDRFLAAAPTLRGEGDEETILRAVETIKVGFAEPDANARRFLASELHLPLCLARRLRWVCWVV